MALLILLVLLALNVDRDLYPVDEACERLGGIGRTHLYSLIQRGEVDSVTVGRRRMVPRAAIDAYIAKLQGKAS